jgi:hypothetical protein
MRLSVTRDELVRDDVEVAQRTLVDRPAVWVLGRDLLEIGGDA